eukprot:2340636-Pleurochrysis_carterae.AAC.5
MSKKRQSEGAGQCKESTETNTRASKAAKKADTGKAACEQPNPPVPNPACSEEMVPLAEVCKASDMIGSRLMDGHIEQLLAKKPRAVKAIVLASKYPGEPLPEEMGGWRAKVATKAHRCGHLCVEKDSSDEPPPDVGVAMSVDTLAELEPCEKTEYHPASDGADEADGDMDKGESNDEAAECKAEVVADGCADTVEKT